MSAEIHEFSEFAGSGRGLMARPVMPDNIVALQSHIQSIDYEVHNLTDGGAPVLGSLVVADVMKTALTPWHKDSVGYTFLWAAPGTLWPLAGKKYRLVLTFTQTPAAGGRSFIEAWQANTKNPAG